MLNARQMAPALSPCASRTSTSRSIPMIRSGVYIFRAISSSIQSSEIAGFAQSTWTRLRGAGHLKTGTKLILLSAAFVIAIVVAIYSLFSEKQIAISFARNELVGVTYLEKLRDVYASILDVGNLEGASASGARDDALQALAAAEADTRRSKAMPKAVESGGLGTAPFVHSLTEALDRLWSGGAANEDSSAVVTALSRAQDLTTQVGDESNLALDPDLDSWTPARTGFLWRIICRRALEAR